MVISASKATARSYFEEVVNRGNMSAADTIFASEVQFHYPLGVLSGALDACRFADRRVPRKGTYRPEGERARHYGLRCCERQDS